MRTALKIVEKNIFKYVFQKSYAFQDQDQENFAH